MGSFRSVGDMPLGGLLGQSIGRFSLCFLSTVKRDFFLPHALTQGPESTGKGPWTETSEIRNKNMLSLFIDYSSQVFAIVKKRQIAQ